MLPLFMNITEILQGFNLFPGTFDIVDILCYDIPVIVYILNYIYGHENEMYNVGLNLKEGEGL